MADIGWARLLGQLAACIGNTRQGVGGNQNRRQDGGYEQLTAIEPGDKAAR